MSNKSLTLAPSVGDALAELVVNPSPITLFRFSAVTWNPHRIHYDAGYAATEGYPNVLVQSHLHGSFIAECALRWCGAGWALVGLSWKNRGVAFASDRLTLTGHVESVAGERVECVVEERNQAGEICATGRVVLMRKLESE